MSIWRFGSANTDYASVPDQTKIGNLTTTLGVMARANGNFFLNTPVVGIRRLWACTGASALRVQVSNNGGNEYLLSWADTNNGTIASGTSAVFTPVAGTFYIVYASLQTGAGNTRFGIYNSDGSVLVESTHTGVAPNPNAGGFQIGDSVNGLAFDVDGLAVLNAHRAAGAGGARTTNPLTTDGDVVAVYYFSEGTGTSVADGIAKRYGAHADRSDRVDDGRRVGSGGRSRFSKCIMAYATYVLTTIYNKIL
jgi:hypothetical protein